MDLSAGWWTIPAERSRNGLAHRVPPSPPAVQILKALRLQGEKAAAGAKQEPSLWIFPSRHKRLPHMAHAQKAIERVVASSNVAFRGHHLRRTAASLMMGAGVSRLDVSKILNHVETGVTAVYGRHSYDREKREALEFWGRRLLAIVANKRQKSKMLRFAAAS